MTPPGRPLAVLAATIFIFLIVACLSASWVEAALGVDASEVDLLGRFAPPSWQHPLGTDDLGRDLLVRLLQGGQIFVVGDSLREASSSFGD